jgi:ABC-type antimicrobial peptide transport system ATPase subunit
MQRRGFLRALVATVAAVNMPSLAIAKDITNDVISPVLKEVPKFLPSGPGPVEPITFSIGKGREFENVQGFLKWAKDRPDVDVEYVGEIYESQTIETALTFEHCEYKRVLIRPAPCFVNNVHFVGKRPPTPDPDKYVVHHVGPYLANKDIASLVKRLHA